MGRITMADLVYDKLKKLVDKEHLCHECDHIMDKRRLEVNETVYNHKHFFCSYMCLYKWAESYKDHREGKDC